MQYEMLAVPKGMAVKEPTRAPDMYSKRGVPYWFGPDWVRKVGKTCGRILPVLDEGSDRVELHMLSADGNLSYIEGSIQREFFSWLSSNNNTVVPWREDLQVDCMLLGVKPEELLLSDWKYEAKK
jgi:hypothetical protein